MLNNRVDPSQLKDIEERIKNLQKAIQQPGQEVPDVASILRVIEQRATTRAPSSRGTTTRSFNPAPSSMGNETIQRAQAQWQAKQANTQYEATQSGAFGANSESLPSDPGNNGPPGPPRLPRYAAFKDFPHNSGREEANKFLQSMNHEMVHTTLIHLDKPPSYDGKDPSKFRPWWYKIEAYLDTYAVSFTSDAQQDQLGRLHAHRQGPDLA